MRRVEFSVELSAEHAKWCDGKAPAELAQAVQIGISAIMSARGSLPEKIPPPEKSATGMRPSVIGQAGEELVSAALASTFVVKNVARCAHSGDLSVWVDHHNICVEVKNYSRTVPATEVAKFVRDLESTGASGGIFISIGGTAIAGVGASFAIRYEPVAGGVVPCVYVSTTDPAAAVVACQMVANIIRTARSLLADNMTPSAGAVAGMLDVADTIGRIRGDLHAKIGGVIDSLVEANSSLGTVTSTLRRHADSLRDELDIVAVDRDLLARLDETVAFKKYVPGLKASVAMIIGAVDRSGSGVWKLSPKRCFHTLGMGFSWTVVPDFLIPRAMVTGENIIDSLARGKKVSVSAEHLCIEIGADTLELIVSLVSGRVASP